jgi:uncharacterized protein
MPLTFNVRHLEQRELSLKGELPVSELDLDQLDELVHADHPLRYDLEVQKLDNGLLVHGTLALSLKCECARCLKPFPHEISLENWACHLPVEGEEKVEVVNDLVDLTPYVREDIVLAFPQHPLCEPECEGLQSPQKDLASGKLEKKELPSSAWAELNKLKL